MLRSFPEKLHPIEVLWDATNWWSFSFGSHFYTTYHDLWTWSKNRYFHYERGRLFAIFKMHLRVSALVIFWETPLNWSTIGYYKLVQCQLLHSFVHHLQWPANMVEKSILPWLWERSIFFNFQNACPRKCSGHFLRNSTQLKYYRILQTGRVSASILISTPLAMTCEHGPKIDISIMGEWSIFCSFQNVIYRYDDIQFVQIASQ